MATVAIDTLAAMRKLEKAGFKTEQAEAVAEVMGHQSSELATKADIAGLRWTFGIVAGFLFALNLVILGLVYQGNQQTNQQINQLTQQVAHLSGVVLPDTDRN